MSPSVTSITSPPGRCCNLATMCGDRSIPVTATPLSWRGIAILPVPIPNSRAGPSPASSPRMCTVAATASGACIPVSAEASIAAIRASKIGSVTSQSYYALPPTHQTCNQRQPRAERTADVTSVGLSGDHSGRLSALASGRVMNDCIFCAIAAGESPSLRVAESNMALAFLDLNPASRGHTLVIPKRHADDIWNLSVEDSAATWALVQEVASKLRAKLDPEGMTLFQANQHAGWPGRLSLPRSCRSALDRRWA